MARGFVYLVAIMDWYSRKVLSWRVSNTLDTGFCVDALEEALDTYGTPEIFNTDEGSRFTSEDFTGALKQHGIRISMDGKGRWITSSSSACGAVCEVRGSVPEGLKSAARLVARPMSFATCSPKTLLG